MICCCALAIGLVIGVVIMLVGRGSDQKESSAQRSVAQPADVADPADVAVPTTAAEPPIDVTFQTMNDAARRFYVMLPERAASAWPLLGSSYQATTGRTEFLDWWASVDSVTVLSVSPRDASSVVVRLRFVMNDRRTDTEDRWLSFDPGPDGLVVRDSERIGSV